MEPQRTAIDSAALLRLLPHKPPFVLVDSIEELEAGRRGVGTKTVTSTEYPMAAHFPGNPIFPGVLIVEACAQLTAIVMGSLAATGRASGAGDAPAVEYLAAINRFKFMGIAVPGDRLRLMSTIGKRVGELLQATVEVHLGRRQIAAGELVVTIRNNPALVGEGARL